MSSQLFLNNKNNRTKSNERTRHPKSNSPISRPSSKHISKNQLHNNNNIIHNDHHQNIIVNKINLQKGQIQIEGELNFQNKNQKQNNQNKGKNVGHNAFELMSQNNSNCKITRKGNFNITKKKLINNKVPRKSPLPVPKNYKPKNNLLNFQKKKHSNNFNNNNSGHTHAKSVNVNSTNKLLSSNNNNQANNTYNTFKQKNNLNNRSLSPITRIKENTPKLSPNFLKTKLISKSPNPIGNIINKYKNFHLGSSTSGNSNSNSKKQILNNSNRNIIKKAIHNNNNIKRVNNVNIHPNKKMIISGDLTQDSTNNSKINISRSGNISINNHNINNKKDNKSKQLKNHSNKNNINETKHNNSSNNIINNHSNNSLNSNTIGQSDKDSLTISQQMQKTTKEGMTERSQNNNPESPKNIRNEKEEKKEFPIKLNQRSNSQPQSNIIKNIEKTEKIEKISTKPENKKIQKKIKNMHTFTHVGFDGEQDKENNQDSYFIYSNFAGNKLYYYMSVCDGHGVEGHYVSNFIKEILPSTLSNNLQGKNILKNSEIIHEIITEVFLMANEQLIENENINSAFSGSTCVSVIYTPERLISANIGDSRAVLGRYDKESGKYKSIDLTRDHKPTEEDEAKRIIDNDGRIQPFIDEGEFIGPSRVWVKEDDVPGLAMTRSFGDRVAATVGVISEPEIKEWDLQNDDKFLIVASDGIWEFISSQECVQFVSQFYENNDIKGCAQFLYEESKKRWIAEEEVVDDITMILVFFE